MVADEMGFMAVIAGVKMVMTGKLIPVITLGWTECSCTVTERTGIPQGGKDGGADKIRPVGNTFHCIGQGLIHFECDDFTFLAFCRHSTPGITW